MLKEFDIFQTQFFIFLKDRIDVYDFFTRLKIMLLIVAKTSSILYIHLEKIILLKKCLHE